MTAPVQGSCHCGAQRFAAPPPAEVTHCNCSTCSKRGTVAAYYAPGEVEFSLSRETLASYQWGDRMMTFHHCVTCGCAVFAESDAWTTDGGEARPARITLNARLFDDFDLEAVPVRRVDGRNGW
ncbi:GFA family protein [Brevundimonas sp.]|uniref:GFA family protein n=1 Tax=Brevundimonas sp. TaxID=1871086 RepID=UPI002D30CABC|nr:GFA family protein [Brevundimonas sp.]HYC69527.1 GFA family protein [Brevundimonas sp.]